MDKTLKTIINKQNKISKLNFNLKNEIIQFLPIEQLLEEIFYIDKSFLFAIYNKNPLNILKRNFKVLINEMNFTKQRINEVYQKYFLDTRLFKESFYDIFAVLLLKKHKKNKNFEFDLVDSKYKKSVLLRFVKHNKFIKKLIIKNLNDKQYKETTIHDLWNSLFSCKNEIQNLSLTRNKIGKNSNDILLFSEVLNKQNQLVELNLEDNEIGLFNIFDFKYLFEALSFNQKIQILNISSNYFGYYNENNMKSLKHFIKHNHSLKTLLIKDSCIGMSKSDIHYLSKIISKENSTLKELNIKDNKLGDNQNFESLKNFFLSLAENKNLLDLNLSGNNLICCSDNLYENDNNITIEIFGKKASNNKYKEDNQENLFIYICKAIEKNNYLQNFDLSNNDLGKDKFNFVHLNQAIKVNKKLKKLNIVNNYFDNKAINEIKNNTNKKSNKLTISL